MKKRLLTSLEIVLVLVLAFVLKILVSDYFFDALIVLIACVAAFEASRLFTKMGKYNYIYLATAFPLVLLVVNILGAVFDKNLGIAFVIAIDVALIVVFFGFAFLYGICSQKKMRNEMRIRKIDRTTTLSNYAFNKAFNTAVTFIYPTFAIMLAVLLNHMDSMTSSFAGISKFDGYFSLVAMLFVFLIPIFTDTFAFITGKLIEGKKLMPKVSPNKTISGAIGGIVWCILLSTCTYFILNAISPLNIAFSACGFAVWKIIIISLFGSIICQCGDIVESLVKRKAEVKDSGTIFPGHGGMLDRFDSHTFLIPYLLLAFSILVLVI